MSKVLGQPPLFCFADGSLSTADRPSRIGETKLSYRPTGDILTKSTGFMDAYDFTLNPYSGCSFGCTYCYAAFFSRDVEKRDSWGYWVIVKENAVELLEKRLRHNPASLDDKLIYMKQRHRPLPAGGAGVRSDPPPAGGNGRRPPAQAGGANPQPRRGTGL